MIHLQSKSFVERILDRLSSPFNHRNRKPFSGKFGLGIFPEPHLHELEGLFGRISRNQPAVNAAKDVINLTLASLNLREKQPTELGIRQPVFVGSVHSTHPQNPDPSLEMEPRLPVVEKTNCFASRRFLKAFL